MENKRASCGGSLGSAAPNPPPKETAVSGPSGGQAVLLPPGCGHGCPGPWWARPHCQNPSGFRATPQHTHDRAGFKGATGPGQPRSAAHTASPGQQRCPGRLRGRCGQPSPGPRRAVCFGLDHGHRWGAGSGLDRTAGIHGGNRRHGALQGFGARTRDTHHQVQLAKTMASPLTKPRSWNHEDHLLLWTRLGLG